MKPVPLLALSLLFALPAVSDTGVKPSSLPERINPEGCLSPDDHEDSSAPDETDLEDGIVYYGFLRQCIEGRPTVLAVEMVEHYEGEEAVSEAARDGETLETDVDPVVYVRNTEQELRHLGVKPDARVLMFDCDIPGCPPARVHLDELPRDALYRFRLQNGLIVYIELPYSP